MITSTNAIRSAFLQFFEKKNHLARPSSSLIPWNDNTLLFTNAGMVPFKEFFLGQATPPAKALVSSQRCLRAGGKHNDLENVGYTARHHTFFEMLGNFSFASYGKKEAIAYAWEFLTAVLQLPQEKLWITVHHSDKEARTIWEKEIGLHPSRVLDCGDEDNFWAMGPTGPCGPSSEIYYDHGDSIPGGLPGTPEADGDRFVEIWNLVFMVYNRQENGELLNLPAASIDTGMGLERIAAVLQGKHSNYDTDDFTHLIQAIHHKAITQETTASHRVIADHIRSISFLAMDGVIPSNEGRGYVMRRILRRACRHGHKLGLHDPFLYTLFDTLLPLMQEAYPELKERQSRIRDVILQEEKQFSQTLSAGMHYFEKMLSNCTDHTLDGPALFKLYDTYGFPVDMTCDMLKERGLKADMAGFEKCMEKQRETSKRSHQFAMDQLAKRPQTIASQFVGYEALSCESQVVDVILEPDLQAVVLNVTPFYAEAGGQIGDQGDLIGSNSRFIVSDVKKIGSAIYHIGSFSGPPFAPFDTVFAAVSERFRRDVARHHSATHLLHAALREILGNTVVQKGSLVSNTRLRFDFAFDKALSRSQKRDIERRVCEEIVRNTAVLTKVCDLEEAKAAGAMALFGEKYEEKVRVLSMGDTFSKELCGGTHVQHTGDIGIFKIVQEVAIASGVRRIEAVCGLPALAYLQDLEELQMRIANTLQVGSDQIDVGIAQLFEKMKAKDALIASYEEKLVEQYRDLLLAKKDMRSDNMHIVAEKVALSRDTLKKLADALRNGQTKLCVLLISDTEAQPGVVAALSPDLAEHISAGNLLKEWLHHFQAKGGGRKDFAQGALKNQVDTTPFLEKARADLGHLAQKEKGLFFAHNAEKTNPQKAQKNTFQPKA